MKKKVIIGVGAAIVVAVIAIVLVGLLSKQPTVINGSESGNEVVVLDMGEEPSSQQTAQATNNTTGSEQQTEVVVEGDTKEPSQETTETTTETEQQTTEQPPVETEITEEQTTEQETTTPAPVETGTPVANHGELKVSGTDLVDASGNKYQIKGVSTHGIGWFPQYVNKESFRTMRDEWGINCVRLAMYSAEGSGYCTGGNQSELKATVNNGVKYCTELGLYAIIDWHVLGEQNPQTYQTQAIAFFDEMSKKYADYDNVLYEICNEPNGGTTWAQVKSYAEAVIPVIKKNNPDAIIIVGTPTWSQDVDQAAANPIKGYTNIMYTIHFYADTHKEWLRTRMVNAKRAGIPIFCTEFSICDASGNGALNKTEGNAWIKTLNDNNISYCIWSLCNKAESSALISSNCTKLSGWTASDISEVGKWYIDILGNKIELGSTSTETTENTQENQNNQNNNQNQTTTETASSANIEVSLVSDNSWDAAGGKKGYQYKLVIKNTSSSAVKNWKITIAYDKSISLDNSWNGNYAVNGTKLTVTPVDYNKEIAAGSSVEVGFIVIASGAVGNPTITIE